MLKTKNAVVEGIVRVCETKEREAEEVADKIINRAIIKKITIFVKITKFLIVFLLTTLKLIWFVAKLFIYPFTVLVLFTSIIIVYITIKPDKHTTSAIRRVVDVYNLFSSSDIVFDNIKLTIDKKNQGLLLFDFNEIKIGDKLQITDLQISFNIFKLLINKTIRFKVLGGSIYVSSNSDGDVNIYQVIDNIIKCIDSTLTTILPLRNQFWGTLDIVINTESTKGLSFTVVTDIFEDGINNTLKITLSNIKSNFIFAEPANYNISAECYKAKNDFRCLSSIDLTKLDIKNIGTIVLPKADVIISKDSNNDEYFINYNLTVKNITLDNLPKLQNAKNINALSIENVIFSGNLNKAELAFNIGNINARSIVEFNNNIASKTYNVIEQYFKKLISSENTICQPVFKYKTEFYNYKSNLAQINIDDIKQILNIFITKSQYINSIKSGSFTNATLSGFIGKNCLKNFIFNSNLTNSEVILDIDGNKLDITNKLLTINVDKNDLVIEQKEPIVANLLNENQTKNDQFNQLYIESGKTYINFASNTININHNFNGDGRLVAKFIKPISSGIVYKMLYNTLDKSSINLSLPLKYDSKTYLNNINLFIKLNFAKFYSPFVVSTDPLAVIISKQQKQDDFNIIASYNDIGTGNNSGINSLVFNSTKFTLALNLNSKQIIIKAFDKNTDLKKFELQNTNHFLKPLNFENYFNCHNCAESLSLSVTNNKEGGISEIKSLIKTKISDAIFEYSAQNNSILLEGKKFDFAKAMGVYYTYYMWNKQYNAKQTKIINSPSNKDLFKEVSQIIFPSVKVNLNNVKMFGDINTNINFILNVSDNKRQIAQTKPKNTKLKFANINTITIDSSLIKWNFNSNPEDLGNYITAAIPDLNNFYNAIGLEELGNFDIQSGKLNVISIIEKDKNNNIFLKVKNNVDGVNLKSQSLNVDNVIGGFDTITALKNVNGNYEIDPSKKVIIKDLIFKNALHTVFGAGYINLEDFTIDAKLSYSPTLLYSVQQSPVIGHALKAISLYRDEGFSSLTYTIKGSLFQPEVKFGSVSFLMFKIGRIGK